MAEIPKALKYEERFAFGLTFKQLIWLLSASLLAMIVIFKVGLALEYKLTISAAILGIASLVAFFNFDSWLKRLLHYLSFREAGYFDRRLLKLLEISDVKDDTILLRDGRRLAILSASPINLAVKSRQERDAISQAFRQLLDSLEFPIQICVRTVDSLRDLRNYFDKFKECIEHKKTPQLKAFFLEHRRFFEQYVQDNAVKNRLFYIIIPGSNDLDARTELIRQKLAACGVATRRLNTRQLISLLASYFEEFVEVDEEYLFPITMLKKMRVDVQK
jgi:hypothetical protein